MVRSSSDMEAYVYAQRRKDDDTGIVKIGLHTGTRQKLWSRYATYHAQQQQIKVCPVDHGMVRVFEAFIHYHLKRKALWVDNELFQADAWIHFDYLAPMCQLEGESIFMMTTDSILPRHEIKVIGRACEDLIQSIISKAVSRAETSAQRLERQRKRDEEAASQQEAERQRQKDNAVLAKAAAAEASQKLEPLKRFAETNCVFDASAEEGTPVVKLKGAYLQFLADSGLACDTKTHPFNVNIITLGHTQWSVHKRVVCKSCGKKAVIGCCDLYARDNRTTRGATVPYLRLV